MLRCLAILLTTYIPQCLTAFICLGIYELITLHLLVKVRTVTLLFEEFVPSQFHQDVYHSNHSGVLGQVQSISVLVWFILTQVSCVLQSHQFT